MEKIILVVSFVLILFMAFGMVAMTEANIYLRQAIFWTLFSIYMFFLARFIRKGAAEESLRKQNKHS